MNKSRLEAFSDGVIAIIITIMVLELKVPHGETIDVLSPIWPVFIAYVLSFVNLGIYWVNHHHLLQATRHVSGSVLWANLHLLFWLSLIPFTTGWMGENHFATVPTAVYGVVLVMSALAYTILQSALKKHDHGQDSILADAIGKDLKGKASLAIYIAAVLLAFVNHWIALAMYVLVAVIWFVPDSRIEKRFHK